MKFIPIKVGDRRTEQPQTFGDGRLMEGRVVYVHPKGRWYTVEFEVVPLIQKMMQFGNVIKMGTEKGKPVKIREAFQAAPLPGVQPMEHANAWKRGLYKA